MHRKLLRWLIKILAGFFLLLLLTYAIIQLPFIQRKMVAGVIKKVEEKTGAKIQIKRVYLTFPKKIAFSQLLIGDQQPDTLLFIDNCKIDISMFALLKNTIRVSSLELTGVKGNVFRRENEEDFNFQFLLDSLTSKQEKDGSASNSWKFEIGKVQLSNHTVHFHDSLRHQFHDLKLGNFEADIEELDLVDNDFSIPDITLENTNYSFASYSVDSSSSESEEGVKLPLIRLDKINVKNVFFHFSNPSIELSASVLQGKLRPNVVDLSRQKIIVNSIDVKDSHTIFLLKQSDTPAESVVGKIPEEYYGTLFGQIGWYISANEVKMKNGAFKMDVVGQPQLDGFDYQHMNFHAIDFHADHLLFSDSLINTNLLHLSGKEKDQIHIKDLQAKCRIDPGGMYAHDLRLASEKTDFTGDLEMHYPHVFDIADDLGRLELQGNIPSATIDLNDALYFVPYFEGRERLEYFRDKSAVISVELTGALENLSFKKASIDMPPGIRMDFTGDIKGLPTIENLAYQVNDLEVEGDDNFVNAFLPDPTFKKYLPPHWSFTGKGNGNGNLHKLHYELRTSYGNASLNGALNVNPQFSDSTSLLLAVEKLELGKILESKWIGSSDFQLEVNAENLSAKEASIKGNISKMTINDLPYSNISFLIDYQRLSHFEINSDDPKATFHLKGNYQEVDSVQNLDYQLSIRQISLNDLLGLNTSYIVRSDIRGEYEYAPYKGFDGKTDILQLLVLRDSVPHHLGNIHFSSQMNKSEMDFKINSHVINGYLKGNTSPDEFRQILNRQFSRHIYGIDSTHDFSDKHIDFNLQFLETELLIDAFAAKVECLEISNFEGHYNGTHDRLTGEIIIPGMRISGVDLKQAELTMNADQDSLVAAFTIRQIAYDSLKIDHLAVNGQFKQDTVLLDVNKYDSAGHAQYHLTNQFIYSKENIALYFPNESLLWNYAEWKRQGNKYLALKDSVNSEISFSKENQKITFNSNEKQFILNFEDFNLDNFTGLISHSDSLIALDGIVNGSFLFQLESPFLFEADFNFDSLAYKTNDLGTFQIFAAKENQNQYNFGFMSKYQKNEFRLRGLYKDTIDDYSFDVDLIVNWKQMKYFETFIPSISEIDGEIVGDAKFTGSRKSFFASGDISFRSISFQNDLLLTKYTLPDGKLSFKNFNAVFENVKLFDQKNNTLSIDGSINYSQYPILNYNLNVNSDRFTFMNNTIKENEVFHGNLVATSSFKLTGNSKKPILNSSIKIEPSTDLTYIFPGQDLELITDQGIVVWNDEELKESNEGFFSSDSLTNLLGAYSISVLLNIDKKASFTLITDPKSGDIAKFNLDGQLQVKQVAGNTPIFTGVIETTGGFYELSFYGLVKKRFDLVPKSKIIWSGEMLDGGIDISASHSIKTNSAALVASETGGAEGSRYNQRLDYNVILKITGTLNNPELRFLLDLKEEHSNSYMLIANKLEQLNQPENEAERNKQVFALLVTGSFLADAPGSTVGGSSNNFATSAARNSVNGILTQQLNNITNQYIKFVDFNVGVNTYENHSTGKSETRTDLDLQVSKKLFNERVTVEVESSINLDNSNTQQTSNPGKATNFEYSVLYDITESGNYKIKAFRENAYDLFDGEIQNSGIAFIFIKEFDPKNSGQNRDAAKPEEPKIKTEE